MPQNTIAVFQGATQGNGVGGELSENLRTSVGSLRRHVAASHQAEGRGRQGAGSCKVGAGGWGSTKEKQRNWKRLSPAGLSSGNILGRKEKAPLAGSSHAGGI